MPDYVTPDLIRGPASSFLMRLDSGLSEGQFILSLSMGRNDNIRIY